MTMTYQHRNQIHNHQATSATPTPAPAPNGRLPPRSDSLFDLNAYDQLSEPSSKSNAHLVDLPLDLLTHITRLLPITDVLACAPACHHLYSPAAHRLFAHPRIHSIATLDRLLASLTTANQHAASRSEAPALVRRLSLTLPLADLTSHQLERLGAQCPQLHSLSVTDSAASHLWRLEPRHSGPLATLKLESLLSLTPQLTHLSLTSIDPLDTPHLVTHIAAHCPNLVSLALDACISGAANDLLTWRSGVLALRRLAPRLESLAIDVGVGVGGGRKGIIPEEALAVLMRELHCSGLRKLKLAGFNLGASLGLSAELFAGMLTRHPALVELHLERIECGGNSNKDWVEDGIIEAWKVPQGKRGHRRRVVLKHVGGAITGDVKARIEQDCDGVVVEVSGNS